MLDQRVPEWNVGVIVPSGRGRVVAVIVRIPGTYAGLFDLRFSVFWAHNLSCSDIAEQGDSLLD